MAEADNNGPFSNRRLSFIIIIIGMVFLAGYPIVSIATAQALAQNACNGTLTIYGRCESGVASCVVPTAAVTCSTTVTFPTPFSSATGALQIATNFAGVTTTNTQSSVLGTMNTNTTKWAVPAAITEFRGDTSDRVFVRAPVQIANLQTPTFFYVNVMTAASAGSTLALQCGNGIAPTAWFNLTSVSVSTAGAKQGTVATNPSGWNSCVNTILGAMRVIGFGGDGVTVGAFAQIEVVVARTENVIFVCSYTGLSPTGFTMLVTLGFPLPESAQTIPCGWKYVSETG